MCYLMELRDETQPKLECDIIMSQFFNKESTTSQLVVVSENDECFVLKYYF